MYDDLSLPGGNGNTIKVVKHQQIRNRRDYSSKCKTSESDYKYEPSYIFSFIWKLFNIWVNKKDKTNIKFESIKQLPKFMHNEHFVKICDDNDPFWQYDNYSEGRKHPKNKGNNQDESIKNKLEDGTKAIVTDVKSFKDINAYSDINKQQDTDKNSDANKSSDVDTKSDFKESSDTDKLYNSNQLKDIEEPASCKYFTDTNVGKTNVNSDDKTLKMESNKKSKLKNSISIIIKEKDETEVSCIPNSSLTVTVENDPKDKTTVEISKSSTKEKLSDEPSSTNDNPSTDRSQSRNKIDKNVPVCKDKSKTEDITSKKSTISKKKSSHKKLDKCGFGKLGDLLLVKPLSTISFYLNEKTEQYCATLLVRNSTKGKSDKIVTFKIKTNAPDKYSVKPNIAALTPGGSVEIKFHLFTNCESSTKTDRFLLMYNSLDDCTNDLVGYWKKNHDKAAKHTFDVCLKKKQFRARCLRNYFYIGIISVIILFLILLCIFKRSWFCVTDLFCPCPGGLCPITRVSYLKSLETTCDDKNNFNYFDCCD